MSVEQCERLLEQALQALNDRDWDASGRVFAEALVTHTQVVWLRLGQARRPAPRVAETKTK